VRNKLTRTFGAFFVLGALAWTAGAPTSASALSNCAVADLSVDSEEQAFLGLINAYRARHNAPALAMDPALTRAATWMAEDLAGRSTFAHTDSLGRSPWKRMPDCGVETPGGENLAAGTNSSSAQWALDAWISSASHREVMLTAEFKSIGISRVYRSGSYYGWYWVTDFGYSGGQAPPPPPPTATPTPVPAAIAPAPFAPPPPAPVQQAEKRTLSAGLSLMTWEGDYLSPDAVFGPSANFIAMVYVFDLGTQQWLRWGPALDPKLRSLTELRQGVQYWVIATRDVEVTIR